MCSVICSVFVLMHAAELLQLFHHALPKPASCRASHVALGHCTEHFVFVYFLHFFSIVRLWQVHWCMVSFVLLPFTLGRAHESFTCAALAKFDTVPAVAVLGSLQDNVQMLQEQKECLPIFFSEEWALDLRMIELALWPLTSHSLWVVKRTPDLRVRGRHILQTNHTDTWWILILFPL